MNKGIRKSTGKIIAFMNSDDWYYNDNVFKNIALCFEKSNADIVYGDYIRMWQDENEDYKYFSVANEDPETLHFSFPFCHQAMFMKKTLFDILGEYRTDYKVSADYEWILKAYVNNFKFQYIPQCICGWSYGGYSYRNTSLNIEECKAIRLNMLPDAKRALYYDKIIQTYENSKISIIESMFFTADESMIKVLQNCLKEYNEKLILWGAGRHGKRVKRFLDKIGINILSFMDNDVNKWGLIVEGTQVEKPYYISDKNINVLITIRNDNGVKEQLYELGYDKKNILTETNFFNETYDKYISATEN